MAHFELRSPAGRLAAIHDPPQGPPPERGPAAAVVCHPHPLEGGTMDNKVVFTVAKALRERGLHVVRFNFRGAGGSEGSHDRGVGELDDARAALDAAAGLLDPAPPDDQAPPGGHVMPGRLLMAGFSFGSYVGCSAALDDPRVGALLAIAPPVNYYDFGAVAATRKPLTVICAEQDELVPLAEVLAFAARCARPPRVHRVAGAGHLFHGRLGEIRAAVLSLLDELGGGSATPLR